MSFDPLQRLENRKAYFHRLVVDVLRVETVAVNSAVEVVIVNRGKKVENYGYFGPARCH